MTFFSIIFTILQRGLYFDDADLLTSEKSQISVFRTERMNGFPSDTRLHRHIVGLVINNFFFTLEHLHVKFLWKGTNCLVETCLKAKYNN